MKVLSFSKELARNILYPFCNLYLKTHPLDINVLSLEETVFALKDRRKSFIRYGDGELKLINGKSLYFQEWNEELAKKLNDILYTRDENILVGISDTFSRLNTLRQKSKVFWVINIVCNYNQYKRLPKRIWANSFLSRPYIQYKDKNKDNFFASLRSLWEDRDIVFVEGETTRNGVGNTLYQNAKSIHRIICPPNNSFSLCNVIENACKKVATKDTLFLLSLGPTAKIIAYDLFKLGFQVFDIGHLDYEYECFCSGTGDRVFIKGKHSAEVKDTEILSCTDETYLSEIIWDYRNIKTTSTEN